MSRATPQMRDLAQWLMTYEARGKASSEAKFPAAFQVCEKLRPHLAILMGNASFCALLSRALVVAQSEVGSLRMVQVKVDGSLEGLDGPEARVTPEEMAEGGIVLVAQLLGLLVAFIGENLTLRMVREVWPKLRLNHWDFGKGDKNEKAK